ncbi:MAG: hypothetical protein K9H64_23510, partial [Bacteroidales bacterium]|nr:hypothetical protein [Bacteroidales bacterium]MCF8459004.1 hypothetical protein [Bacteroidales bacterium]
KYWYDALYRLTKATGRELSSLAIPSDTDFVNNIPVPNTASNAMQNYTQEYRYDELGNIEQMRSVGDWTRDYYYETVNNRLKNHDNQTDVYGYDEHGNCIEMPHLPELIWDYKDELKEVTLNASSHKAYYTYDASGERVRKVVDKGSVVEERLYLGGFEVYRKTISGTLNYERETLKITEGRNTIAQLETKTVENGNTISTPTTNQRFQYSNHLGSACLELDSNAAIISYEEYHPFGTTSYRSGSSETEVSLKRYKYVGKERDEETGLYYYGARYYAAWIARFVSVDPLQFEYGHLTPYNYAGNKPITFIDIDGLQSNGEKKNNGDQGNPPNDPGFAKSIYRSFMGEDYINRAESLAYRRKIPKSNLIDMGNSTMVAIEEQKITFPVSDGQGGYEAKTFTEINYHVFRQAKEDTKFFSFGKDNDDYNLSAIQLSQIRVLGYTPLDFDFGGKTALKSGLQLASMGKSSILSVLKKTNRIINKSLSDAKKVRFPVWGDDLIDKGFHLHIDEVELGLRYVDDQINLVNVGKKSTTAKKIADAGGIVQMAFQNLEWRRKLYLDLIKMRDNLSGTIEYSKKYGTINRNAETSLNQINQIITKIQSYGGL